MCCMCDALNGVSGHKLPVEGVMMAGFILGIVVKDQSEKIKASPAIFLCEKHITALRDLRNAASLGASKLPDSKVARMVPGMLEDPLTFLNDDGEGAN